MKIGLIDVDGHNYPNLPLMKLSAWHKANGDDVEWYNYLLSGHCDRVYMSKVFTFTDDYSEPIDTDEIVKGGTGYFYPTGGNTLPEEIEHIYPDYDLYKGIVEDVDNTAYGFMTRGCPRGCDFCIVKDKEGRRSYKVADLSEFWNGQKNIELLDPNTLACPEWENVLQQLIDSGARVNFNQGLDIRMMTPQKAEMLGQIKISAIHFAWDRIKDKDIILPKFEQFRELSKIHPHNLQVYVLTNFDSTHEEDLERIYTLRSMGYAPYVMIYEKDKLPRGHVTRKLQRWVNNRFIFWSCPTFDEYLKEHK